MNKYTDIPERNFIYTEFGVFTVEDGVLVCGDENDIIRLENDHWVEVSDMSDLSKTQYDLLAGMLDRIFDYKLNGQFL